jgi:hypothetical protein
MVTGRYSETGGGGYAVREASCAGRYTEPRGGPFARTAGVWYPPARIPEASRADISNTGTARCELTVRSRAREALARRSGVRYRVQP